MFTTNHFIWMGICAVVIGGLLFASLKFKFSFKTSALIMSGIALVSELSKIFSHIEESADGGRLSPAYLPLHLCSILIFLIFFVTFSKNEQLVRKIASFIVPIAIWGGALAILIPTSGVDFAKPYAYQCFVYHSGLVWFALYLIFAKQVDLGLKSYLRNLSVLSCMLIAMIWVNGALSEYNTNFFYVVRPPMKNLPILNLDNGWFAYFMTIVAIGLVAVTLTHLRGIIRDIKAIKERTKEK